MPLVAPPQLMSLAAIERELRAMESRREEANADARAAGDSWDQVAAVLGISRQAAWERYREAVLGQLTESDAEDEVLANAPEFDDRELAAWGDHAAGRSVRLEDLD